MSAVTAEEAEIGANGDGHAVDVDASLGPVARLLEWAQVTQHRVAAWLEETRPRNSVLDVLVLTWGRDAQAGGVILSGALAFRFFLFLVPYTVFLLTAVGAVSRAITGSSIRVSHLVGVTGLLAKGVQNTKTVSGAGLAFLLFSTLYATISGSRVFVRVLAGVHTLVWREPRRTKMGLKGTFAFIGIMFFLTSLFAGLSRLREVALGLGLIITLGSIVVPFLIAWWAMGKLPHGDAPIWALLPGAALFAVGIEVVVAVTTLFGSTLITRKSHDYGVIGIALTVLLLAFILGRLVVGAATLNATLWERRSERVAAGAGLSSSAPEAQPGQRTRWAAFRRWVRDASGLFR
jgi:uncharacterized BrkB/YihY/UPF0761 family membrane protein